MRSASKETASGAFRGGAKRRQITDCGTERWISLLTLLDDWTQELLAPAEGPRNYCVRGDGACNSCAQWLWTWAQSRDNGETDGASSERNRRKAHRVLRENTSWHELCFYLAWGPKPCSSAECSADFWYTRSSAPTSPATLSRLAVLSYYQRLQWNRERRRNRNQNRS